MIKKIFYIGLLLVAVAIILSFPISGTLTNAIGNAVNSNTTALNNMFAEAFNSIGTVENITVTGGNFIPLKISSAGITGNATFYLDANISSSLNVYLFNQSGYSTWTAYLNGGVSRSGINEARLLEGSGTLLLYNAVHGLIAYQSLNTTPALPSTIKYSSPSYQYGAINISHSGNYYLVFDNTNGSASSSRSVTAKVVYLDPTSESALASNPYVVNATDALNSRYNTALYNALDGMIIPLLVAAGALIAGIIAILYGLFAKPHAPTTNPVQGSSSAGRVLGSAGVVFRDWYAIRPWTAL